jgi:hypothetical protein
MEKIFKGTDKQATYSRGHDFSINNWVLGIGDVPFADLDFVGVTYDQHEPVALIDWKRDGAKGSSRSDSSLKAITNLARRASLPFFVIHYAVEQTWFTVIPKNELASKYASDLQRFTPRDFVAFMFSLSGRTAPDDILVRYSDQFPADLAAKDAAVDQWFDKTTGGAK